MKLEPIKIMMFHIRLTCIPFILACTFPLLTMACSGQAASQQTEHATITESRDTTTATQAEKSLPLPSLIYTSEDSLRVITLLKEAALLPDTVCRMAHFGNKFLGIPYVAHTLEVSDEEKLVINLREMDCTTLVETCTALTLADQRKEHTFHGFCRALAQLRYRNGICDGYPSRLHYFSQWIADNEGLGLVEEITHEGAPFLATQTLDMHYMSQQPHLYTHLKKHPEEVNIIRHWEEELNGQQVRYIPKSRLNGSPTQLCDIQTGDILAIITAKKGLDTSHLGIAVWQNGRLHLLNASQIYKKVVIDQNTLHTYSAKRPSNLGIRVVRLKKF